MLKKNILFLITLILSTLVLQIPAFATTATISISGDRGVVGLSASASFPVDPTTGKTGGTITIRRDGLSLYQASPTTSSWSYSRQYDTTGLADGSHVFTITATAWDGSVSSASQTIIIHNAPAVDIISPVEGVVRGVTEVNIAYSFPSSLSTFSYVALELTVDGGSLPGYSKWLFLNSASETQGTWKVTIDTSLIWHDGPHTLKVIARLPTGGSNTATDTVNIESNNTPVVNIISPQGTVKGVTEVNIAYSFPSLKQPIGSQPYLSLTIDDGALTGYVKWFSLSSTSETVGNWVFNIDTKNWQDGPHAFKVATLTYNVGTTLSNITVANNTVEIPKTKQPPQDKTTAVAEPINVATGNMFTSSTDILIPSKEIPLELSRTYNSQDDFNGSSGYGWRSNFDITLSEQPDHSVIEVDEKGVYTIYAKNPDGTYTPSAGKYSTLTKNPDGGFIILRKHGRKLYFNSSGLLNKIEERNSHSLNILRDSNGIITEVSDSSYRKLTFTKDAQGKITQVTDPAGRIFKYEYDANGNLIKTVDSLNNATLYQYDSSHNLIQQADANGHSLNFEYDSSDRAYHSRQDDHNNEVTLDFDPVNKTTITTDSLGNATKYEYNDYGLVTKITDSQSNIQLFGWDGQLNKISTTNQNGFTTTFTYNARGNLLTIKDPLNNTTTFTYDPNFDLISSVTDTLGNKTEYLYDAKGNLSQIKDALGNTTEYSYDAQGQLLQTTDGNSHSTNFAYDIYGNLIQITDSLNNATNFTYDIIGNLIRITDAKGNPTQFSYDLLNHLTKITYPDSSQVNYGYDKVGNFISFTDQNGSAATYAYDAVNRLTRVIDVLGSITQYTYDTEGNRLNIIDTALNKTQYLYDSLNRLIKTLDPLNHQTLFSYDPAGSLISKTDANGNTITYTYDANNRLTRITYPDTSTMSFTYDALGRRASMTDSSGITTYSYDGLGQLIQVDGPQASDAISYVYDKVGNRLQMTNPDGGITNYTYDGLNRPVSITDPQGKTTTYAYDSLSNLIQEVYPNNTQANYAFDNLNRLVSLANRAGVDTLSSYAYEYNSLGMRTKVTLSDGSYTTYSYDSLSRLIAESRSSVDGQGIFSSGYQFDLLGNRLSCARTDYHSFTDDFNRSNDSALGNNWLEVTGDWQIDNSRIFMPNAETDATLIYPGQTIPSPVIESTVQLETVGNKKGSYIIFSYQNPNDFYYAGLEGVSDLWVMGHYQNGNYNDLMTLSEPIEKLIDYHLRVTVIDNSVTLESLENGAYTKKLKHIFTSLPPGKVGLSAEKSRTSFDDFKVCWQATQTTISSYNPNNQLTQSIADGSITAYAYDKNGNLIQKSEAADITDYAYDYENRLSGINLPNGTNIAYRYDALGRRISKDTNGQITNYLYDTEDILSEQFPSETITHTHGPGIDNPISMSKASGQYYYHNDGLGSIVQLTNPSGSIIQSYQYDAYGNIIQKQGNLPNQFTYTGRELDSESGLYYYRNRYYDPKIGRFTSQDPLGMVDGPNLYTYVNNNPINFIDPWGFSKKNNNVKEELGLVEDYFGIDLLVLGIIAAVEPTPAGEVALVGRIAGYTKHGLEQAIGREGKGVAAKAILGAVKNPIKIIRQSGGRIKYIGKQATVIINRMGKIITTWGQPR